MSTDNMKTVVHLERCILRASTTEDYKRVLEQSFSMDGSCTQLLQAVMQQTAEVQLGQTVTVCGGCPTILTAVDLVPATAGVLSEATTLIVLPPAASVDSEETCYTLLAEENIYENKNEGENEDICVVLLDSSLTGSTANASEKFFLCTLLMDGAVVYVGNEEYRTVFSINMKKQGVGDSDNVPTLYASPDVFRNIRASILLDYLPFMMLTGLQYSDRRIHVPLSAFYSVQNSKGTLLTLLDTQGDGDGGGRCDELHMSCVILVPAWPTFMLTAFLGETYEQMITLALHASKKELHGRIVAEGDVIVLHITPQLFVEQQLICLDVMESALAHAAHLAQSGHAETAMRSLMHMDGVISIPLRVAEVTTSSGNPYGWLDLNDHSTEVLLSLRSPMTWIDTTPLFPPSRPHETFYLHLSLTASICHMLKSSFSPSYSANKIHVFVVHAIPENFPYECITTALAMNGVNALIADLDRWHGEEMQNLISEYMQSLGEVALVIKNAQLLPDYPKLLQLLDADDITTTKHIGTRVVFLVCESMEAVPPTVAARSRNVEGVLKGTNPSDADRRRIFESLFHETQRSSFPVRKSLLLSFDSVASWTVGLTGADVVAYTQECLSQLRGMRLPEGVHPVLSESLCGSVLQKYQKAHGHNLVSTKLQPVRWCDVGGLEEAKRELRETIQLPLLHPELFSKGTKRRAGVLFYGPPGCGKTLLAKAVATEMNMNFMAVKGPELINQYVGESEKNIRLLFQRARDNSPCIIFFDELDALAPARGAKGDAGGAMDRVVAQLLVEVDGVGHARTDGAAAGEVFIVGATNRPDLLDPSLLRPGRFDRLCYLGLPATREEQLVALRALTRKFNLAEDVDLHALLEPLALDYTGADFFALCSDAMMFAVERLLEGCGVGQEGGTAAVAEESEGVETRLVVHMRDFVRAREQLKPSVSKEDLRRYEFIRAKFTTW